MRIAGSVEVDRPPSQVWAFVADYRNDTSWRAGVTQMRPSQPGPAQVGVITHERLRLLGMTFRTDATITRVEAGRLLEWRAQDRQKQLHGSRLVEPTGPASSRFTEVVEGRLLGPLAAAPTARRVAAPAPSRRRYATAQTAVGG
jgi:Polyketide cyclase / dehydrase and lipid transport